MFRWDGPDRSVRVAATATQQEQRRDRHEYERTERGTGCLRVAGDGVAARLGRLDGGVAHDRRRAGRGEVELAASGGGGRADVLGGRTGEGSGTHDLSFSQIDGYQPRRTCPPVERSLVTSGAPHYMINAVGELVTGKTRTGLPTPVLLLVRYCSWSGTALVRTALVRNCVGPVLLWVCAHPRRALARSLPAPSATRERSGYARLVTRSTLARSGGGRPGRCCSWHR